MISGGSDLRGGYVMRFDSSFICLLVHLVEKYDPEPDMERNQVSASFFSDCQGDWDPCP